MLPSLDDATGMALSTLPSLTQLTAAFVSCASFDWLAPLRHVHTLSLHLDCASAPRSCGGLLVAAAAGHCAHVTSLELTHPTFHAADLGALLAAMPLLASLELNSASTLESLRCFATPALARSLTSLSLLYCRHPSLAPAELRALHGLSALRKLRLTHSLAASLDAVTRAEFTPPSARMPQLAEFEEYSSGR